MPVRELVKQERERERERERKQNTYRDKVVQICGSSKVRVQREKVHRPVAMIASWGVLYHR